ncbi:MAG TPA: LemA family protein [Deferrisomatales bacterium]|nr:LemA family protein [Deferrisomatales bacterium]
MVMDFGMWIILGALLFLAGGAFYAISIYNGLVALKNNADKSWSNIDVLLKQRRDELPKLVAVCERYMQHEAETLEKVTQARNLAAGATTMEAKAEAEGFLTEALKSLFAVTENYPELRADAQFGKLQGRVTSLENEIADRREFFNDSVNIYNIRTEQFPDLVVARGMNLKRRELWKLQPADRADPGVQFSR